MIKLYFSSGKNSHTMPNGAIWDKNGWLCVIGDNSAQIIGFMADRFGEKWSSWYTEEEIKAMNPRKNGIIYTFNIQDNG